MKPPNGHIPLAQSSAVHSAATPKDVRTGRPGRRRAGTTSPNRAVDAAEPSVRAAQAPNPNSAIQESVAP